MTVLGRLKTLPYGAIAVWVVLVAITLLMRKVGVNGPVLEWRELIGIAAFWALAVFFGRAALDYVRHPHGDAHPKPVRVKKARKH